MIAQHLFTKSVLKPSGPGDLSEGKLATIASISSWEKGVERQSSPSALCRSSSRLNNMVGESEVPNLSLKASQMICALI
jgi:hypothetical protein